MSDKTKREPHQSESTSLGHAVLCRSGEVVRIGSNVLVRVIDIKGGRVRLGFRAPKNVEIHREEIYAKIACKRSR